MDHLRIPLSDIESATNNFSANRIGSGGYGTVYKAELDIFDDTISSVPDGKNKADFPKKRKTVAVKRLERKHGEVAGFFTEIEMLTNCKHQNIVSLLGFCEEGPERILVYEHVSNGSLSDYFEKINNRKRLSWAQRLQICLDIAQGLDYLHSNTEEKPMIIHRDIKSDNILLDNNWVAKIADFGLSRLRPANQKASTINTGTIAGTEVYLDPEYMETGRLKKESDIYSFGVVLFEVVSGKLAYDKSYCIKNEKGLLSIVQKCFSEGTLKKVIDPNLKEASEGILILDDGLDQKSLDIFLDIAYQCLAHTQDRRPTMKVIINELEKALNYQENRKDGFHISLKDITSATKNFNDETCIGEGRYGKQYEGRIPLENIPTTVIIKRWDKESHQAHPRFLTELKVVSENKHENIVALVGLCYESGERIIVYEHATKGTLDKHLKDVNLTWIKRLKICVGIATGLKFLHEDAEINHRDIKSSSILLDADWEPKICNFEISSTTQEWLKAEHATDNAYGSLGYLDPLHEKQGYLDKYSDVYSLGVVLMEILCGRLAWGEGCKDHSESLGPLTKRRYKEGKLDELVFEGIKEQFSSQSFTTFASIAVQCLKRQDYIRPEASEVVIQLEKALELQERCEKLQISLEDIKLGTENFSDAKFIGEGRYWKQYKGHIPHANGLTTVVVKRFDTKCDEGSKQFIVESEALFEYKHKNIIHLAGICEEVNEKIIVYEHASNGRLSEHLKDTNLTWLKRLKICINVATGLRFVHTDNVRSFEARTHGNIKSGSILIDGEWKAIITNLELLKSEFTTLKTSQLDEIYAYNSFGYIGPEYNKHGFMTRASDIYALGVVFMEILCGRLAWEDGCKDPSACLGPLAKRRYQEGNIDELVFEGIKKQIDKKSLTTFTDIAIRCIGYYWLERPYPRDVIIELQKALEYQEDYETWEPKLPRDYKELLHFSKIDEMEKFKDIYNTLCKGIHLRDREVGLSRSYCGSDAIFVEGIEFEPIDNLKEEDIKKTMAIQQQLPTYSEKRSGNDYEGGELLPLNEVNVKKHFMLSAMEVLYDCSNVEPFHLEPSAKSRNAHCRLQLQRSHLHLRRSHLHLLRSHLHLRRTTCTSGDLVAPPETGTRFQEVIELLPQQVSGIKSKIRSRMLSPDTDYACYLVFKLSEKCRGLHCPVRVRNVLQWKDKEIGLVWFRPPNQWNSHDTYWVPKRREDGWMEVRVWNFNSTSALRTGRIPMHLKLITYEGTMSGLIVRGLEIRPV
ncbi:serine/threonine-protein kinase, active site protein [Artemisia annua]|uniref:non-specific serine/threonine protein kinase n=1 Tax=Artemisia annua TaxID=35608 RepID=A0A2U1PNB1_ARTAN|nr:serine/threonine-protein kinase, active site protein [Artemisia annua]